MPAQHGELHCAHLARFACASRSASRAAATGRPLHLGFLGGSDAQSSPGYSSTVVIAFVIASLPAKALAIILAINPSDPLLPLLILLQRELAARQLRARQVAHLGGQAGLLGIAGQ